MSESVQYLDTVPASECEEDFFESPRNEYGLLFTARRAAVLTGRLCLMGINKLTDQSHKERTASEDQTLARHVRLQPDSSHLVETEFGTTHKVDVYGENYLGTERSDKRPLVVSSELGTPSDKGFKAPIIDQLSKYCISQERSLITMSSEGFARSLTPQQLWDLSFPVMAHNLQDSLDQLELIKKVDIPEITATGGSLAGTRTLLIGSSDVKHERFARGKKDRIVPWMIPVAPAGLAPMNLQRRARTAKQVLLDEPMYIIREASQMGPYEMSDYGRSYLETRVPASAAPAVAKTALLFLTQSPLAGIGKRLPEDTHISLLALDNDFINAPDNWTDELQDISGAVVSHRNGCHLSLDSTKVVGRFIIDSLQSEYPTGDGYLQPVA